MESKILLMLESFPCPETITILQWDKFSKTWPRHKRSFRSTLLPFITTPCFHAKNCSYSLFSLFDSRLQLGWITGTIFCWVSCSSSVETNLWLWLGKAWLSSVETNSWLRLSKPVATTGFCQWRPLSKAVTVAEFHRCHKINAIHQ